MSLSHKQAMATPIKAIHINGNGDSARRPTPEAGLFQTPTNTRPFKPTALFGDGTPSRMFPGDVRVESLGLSGGSNDPFVSSGMKNRKLSPTADNFKPFAISMNMSATTNSEGGVLLGSPEFGNGQQELGTANVPSFSSSYEPSTTPPITQSGTFTTDGHSSRVLRVIGLWEEVTNEELDASLKRQTGTGVFLRGARHKIREAGGHAMVLRFNDIRDAKEAYAFLKMDRPRWQVEFVDPDVVSKTRSDAELLSKHEGQVSMVATFPTTGNMGRQKMEETLRELLETCGKLQAFQKQLGTGVGVFKLIAEFCDIEAAKFAVQSLHQKTVKEIYIEVVHNTPDIPVNNIVYDNGPITPVRPQGQDDQLVGSMARLGFGSAHSSNPQVHGSGYSVETPSARSFLGANAPQSTPQFVVDGTPYSGTPSYGYPVTPIGPSYYTPSSFVNPYTTVGGQYPPIDGYMNPVSIRPVPWSCPAPYGTWSSPLGNGPRGYGVFGSRTYGGYNPLMTPCHPGLHRRRQVGRSPFSLVLGSQAHNVVDLEKIRQGLDVRTTIMLRNIPNKIDQVMLKSIVDETSLHKYDFMYLRIDFANECNVGYAFINFEDPFDIIDFVKARAGQRWNKFNSDKVAEVSYATIQGKDCLVQKFRNSSVMLEHPSFRPKLYFTTGHPSAGEEEPFAEPDNISKMRRSVENAEHVGLFAPRAGQHYRDEQRRRKSQFDRGTRLAEMEEQEFEFDQFDVGGMGMTYYDSFADAPYEAQYQAYARAQTYTPLN